MKQDTQIQPARALRELFKLPAGIFLALMFLYGTDSRAASGVWINDGSSVWSAGTNWSGGVVADGSGNTADFTLNNTNADTVTLDSSRTLGALQFGNNASAGTNQWILNASGGSILTLAGGTPTIAVSNGVATNIAVAALPIAGASGLTKIGDGTLTLAGTNGYSGNTTVSAGTLKLTNTLTGISTTDPVLYMSFDNVNGGAVINQGTGGAAMNGILTGGAAVVPGGRYGNALSIPAGNAFTSYVLINNAVVPLNGTAGNNWTVAMWVNTTTAGGVYAYQGSGGWVTANTEFYLENGTQGDGAGSHQGGVRNSQAWVSGTANVNDGTWHFLVMTCTNAVRTMYFDGVLDATLSGAGSWGGAGAGNQFRIGGAASAADSNIGLNGLIDEVYMYNRALSPAEVSALMGSSSGPTSIASALPVTTSVSLAAGAKLDLNGSTPTIAGLTGSGTVDTTLAAGTPALVVNATSDITFDGLITNTTGTLSLIKQGNAKLTLTGTNVYNGATTVNAGTLNITGALEPVSPAAAIMNIRSGVVNFSGPYLTNF
ncbi:MAG TPA: LamG-like jellyroll fold domain-containing protein, partial [Verrucomicrobiae bacterium]